MPDDRTPQFEHIRLIYNPNSGTRQLAKQKARLEAAVAKKLGSNILELSPTSRPGDATLMAAEAASRWGESCLVILAGGDGSAGEAAQGLAGSQTPLLILPYGSGNDFSRTIYRGHSRKPEDILAACGLVPSAEEDAACLLEPIDLMRVEADSFSVPSGRNGARQLYTEGDGTLERYVLNTISIGFDSTVAIEADRLQRRFGIGSSGYVIGVVTQAFKDLHYEMEVEWQTDQGKQSAVHPYSLCAVCNGSFYGGGYQPNPQGRLNDGLIDTYVSRHISAADIRYAGKYRRGEAADLDIFTDYHSSAFVFRALAEDLKITLDGEGLYTPELRVTAEANKIILALPSIWGRPMAIS